jgi:site-specific DNA-methyltransferase (adenine-specific)
MSLQANFAPRGRNPDVLTCIANLSNDEVFTPPDFANRMLNTLAEAWAANHGGANLWADRTVTFLDPFTKSGVFLREITSRLTKGLEQEIPDLQDRVNHILTQQVFGIGITQLTSLLARRSVYCSKHATGEHSIAKSFANDAGNIWFQRTEHTWVGGRCTFCGVGQKTFDRGEGLETHAYALIHTDNIKTRLAEIFGGNMQFDVIIGNPPYQMNTEGYGTQARPIYHKFVEQAKNLEPRLLTMVIPARWFSGGMGLDAFRTAMLSDDRLRVIEDFPDSNNVFPGTQIKGGVCYFLWDRDNSGSVRVTTHDKGVASDSVERPLLEPGSDVFIRYNEALPILKKVFAVEIDQPPCPVSPSLPEEKQFTRLVSSIGAFGLDSMFRGKPVKGPRDIKVYRNGGVGYLASAELTKEAHVVNKWKVFIPRAGSGSDAFPHQILGRPFVGEPGSISSWTYMYIGPFRSRAETENVISYINTRLFRFLVLLHKPSQDATRGVYTFVPTQDFSQPWTDRMLYKKYSIAKDEIAFINSMIRPMGDGDE